MPPTRRRSGGPNTSGPGNQSTLSFGGQSRISKPTTTTHTGKKATATTVTQLRQQRQRSTSGGSASASASASPAPEPVPAPVPAEIEPEQRALPASSRSDEVVREQARVELKGRETERERDAVEGLADSVSEEEIEGYWEREEAGRIAPRVHQEHLTRNEKILRHFDLSNQYGPCIGIARVKRWKRAHGLGLNPPIEVLAVLLKEEARGIANEKAYMDELLS
ncbi:hypothetical protein FQN55_001631 [Onygenales sp. PD_40]|nr:hypothetical protein FQN55_001631 [Onygenales sp. PD_40]KAK2788845.1 hypothetical protein FQN53_003032 [Emmonsiellopsis sp. PD_33]